MSEAETVTEDEALADQAALRNLMRKFANAQSISASKKKERKQREKKVRNLTDGRSLKQKGRTVQFNTMIKPDIKQAILDHVAAEGISMADFTERAFTAALNGSAEA